MKNASIILSSVVASLVAASGGACVEHDRGPRGQLALAVAPLELEGIGNACYDVAVRSAADELVWSRGDPALSASDGDTGALCSDQFGNAGGGNIAYVGPCDASEPTHNVTVWVDSLWASTSPFGPLSDWTNPCPYAASGTSGCTLAFTCQENEDVAVTFNLVIMRQARQGFFDVAVNFENIFCSAKVDCTYPIDGGGEQNIELVFDPATGERVPSLVFAFACTDGDPPGMAASPENATHLYLDDLVLACGGTNYVIDPAAGVGNLYPDGVGAPSPIRQAMVFRGRELITNDGEDADKFYWNVAFGWNSTFFDGGTPTCQLLTRATASHGPLVNGATPFNTDYPYIDVNVTVNSGADIVCTQHPLGGQAPHDGVTTAYTGLLYDGTRFAEIMLQNEGAPSGGALDTHPITWLQVSAGGRHTCAIGTSDAVQCWGWNIYGQVPPPTGAFAAVAAGGGHTCALRASGAVECWGLDDYGQAAAPPGSFTVISGGGSHNCGLLVGGDVDCWGQDLFGQSTPPAGTFAAVDAGGFHSCGINAGGTLECWGLNNSGQSTPPVGTFTAVSTGGYHSCGITTGGTLACWGLNDDGQASPPGGAFVAVTAGYFYTCALTSGGALQCWGLNAWGQASPPAGEFTAITAGGQHACAMTAGGEIQCWGLNDDGQTTPP